MVRIAVVVGGVLAAGLRLAHAQVPEAEALFAEAEHLMAAGKVAEACTAYEASNRIEARAGTLIRLADCREQNHQLASAWSAYKDAVSRAKDPKKRAVAVARVAALEPRLSTLTIHIGDAERVTGLAIERNGKPVDVALWNATIPVDGGAYAIRATAPGKTEWKADVSVPIETGKIVVEVPDLGVVAKPVAPVIAAPVVVEPAHVVAHAAPEPAKRSSLRTVAVVTGAGAVALAAVGFVVGKTAKTAQDDAYALCPDPAASCARAADANAKIDSGHTRALAANVLFGTAGVALGAAVVMWVVGRPEHHTETTVSLSPTGFAVARSF